MTKIKTLAIGAMMAMAGTTQASGLDTFRNLMEQQLYSQTAIDACYANVDVMKEMREYFSHADIRSATLQCKQNEETSKLLGITK